MLFGETGGLLLSVESAAVVVIVSRLVVSVPYVGSPGFRTLEHERSFWAKVLLRHGAFLLYLRMQHDDKACKTCFCSAYRAYTIYMCHPIADG